MRKDGGTYHPHYGLISRKKHTTCCKISCSHCSNATDSIKSSYVKMYQSVCSYRRFEGTTILRNVDDVPDEMVQHPRKFESVTFSILYIYYRSKLNSISCEDESLVRYSVYQNTNIHNTNFYYITQNRHP
jgi:hypothetical protein